MIPHESKRFAGRKLRSTKPVIQQRCEIAGVEQAFFMQELNKPHGQGVSFVRRRRKFGIFRMWGRRQISRRGEATFSIQLSSSAFRESSKSVKATPMPIPVLESRTIAEHANSALFQRMQS